MGKILACFFIVFLCFYAGCNSQEKSGIRKVESQPKLNKGSLPAFLAGTWKAKDPDQCKWEFTFEKNGTISAMRNFMGTYVKVSQGVGYEHYAADANVEAACVLGPVEAGFDPNSRLFTVKVVTDYFTFHIYSGIVEGSSVDTLSGPVSGDGLTWKTEWQSVSRVLDGPPMDFNNPLINQATFYKVR